jgi:tRNA (mo5U34)-methyltransferase
MNGVDHIRASRPIDTFKDRQTGISETEFRRRCEGQVIWHSVDLGDLWIEGARKTSEVLAKETKLIRWPDVRGKSVLDIGAFGGWFSFEAERRGASSVTAIDYHSWVVDWPGLRKWVDAEREAGRAPDAYNPPAHLIDEAKQPGRRALDVTRELLGSRVKTELAKFENFESEPFDLTLFLGVLYHCENPMAALRKVASLTKDHLIIETHGIYLPGHEDKAYWEYFGDDAVNADITTWWAPNDKGLADMLKAVGFSRIEMVSGGFNLPAQAKAEARYVRIWAHAWK